MVGTTRFELATSPTPRVRSTRLSHVPTLCALTRRSAAGLFLSVHEPLYLVGGTYSFGSAPPSPKKNSFICSTRNSCASRVPGLQAILIQQHLLPFHPLAPCLLRHILIDLLAKVGVERRFVEPFHLRLVLRAKHHVRHYANELLQRSSFYDASAESAETALLGQHVPIQASGAFPLPFCYGAAPLTCLLVSVCRIDPGSCAKRPSLIFEEISGRTHSHTRMA